ncbi:MAG: SIS domain-containing protein [bacterium]|nr:SIS domain-containing protein [bacterium]
MHGEYTLQEIEEQFRVWEELLYNPPYIDEIDNKDEVIYFGSGTSYYLALSLASFTQYYTGITSRALPSQELIFFSETVITKKPTLYFGISRSGETSEIIMAMERAKSLGKGNFLSITTEGESQLAIKSERAIVISSARENSVVMTKSFTSMLLGVQLGILNSIKSQEIYLLKERLLASSQEVLVTSKNWANEISQKDYKEIIFLGSGPFYGIACESALKVREMSSSLTSAYHTLEFRHGPKASLNRNSLVVMLLSDSAIEEELKIAEEVKNIGAECIIIGDKGENNININSNLNEYLRLVLYMPFAQFLGYYKAIKKGLDPDEPLNLTQVVKI